MKFIPSCLYAFRQSGLSVSRVGSTAQDPLMKEFVGSLKLELAQFREVEFLPH